MIPNTQIREVTTSGVSAVTSFGISLKDTAHIMGILRDTLYSDKVLAVIREYSANAWDEHRQAGKSDVPVKIVLPTSMEPTLTVRDYGRGLSHEDVFQVFTQYGASTKRDSDAAVGMLGIGSKSGFAYSDTFTVTSYHGGFKRIYAAVLDPSDKGEMKLLYEGPSDETGLEIQVPIKPHDIYEFQSKGRSLFRWFHPQPACNVDIQPPVARRLVNGEIHDVSNMGSWVAVMGCIAYRVNLDQLADVPNFNKYQFEKFSGALYFDIGEVGINASREELKYTEATKLALVEKFNALVDEYITDILAQLDRSNVAAWQKRLDAQVLNRLGLAAPEASAEMFARAVPFKPTPVSFTLQLGSNLVSSVSVASDSRLLIQDDHRAIKGFGLREHDYLIKPQGGNTVAVAEAELTKLLDAVKMTGIPVAKLSTLPWSQPVSRRRNGGGLVGPKNIKHRVRSFRLLSDRITFSRPFSNNWEPESEREATSDDVFVILQNFKVDYEFYTLYRKDARIARAFGQTMPAIYGYKTTESKPVAAKDCEGVEYMVWREGWLKSLDNAKAQEIAAHWHWHRAAKGQFFGGYGYWDDLKDKHIAKLTKDLGKKHVITQFAIRSVEGDKFVKTSAFDEDVFNFLEKNVLSTKTKSITHDALKVITDAYPLLGAGNVRLPELWGTEAEHYIAYVKLIDKSNATNDQENA